MPNFTTIRLWPIHKIQFWLWLRPRPQWGTNRTLLARRLDIWKKEEAKERKEKDGKQPEL